MTNRFHLAISAGNLEAAINFYCDILGCTKGNSEVNSTDSWVDINFWGNELTLHATDSKQIDDLELHSVDMGEVIVPHFGVHLSLEEFTNLKQRIENANIAYVSTPHIRFSGTDLEQETMFIKDTHCNILEIKTMKNPDALFKKMRKKK